MTDLVSLHFNNTDCFGTPTAATVTKLPCQEAQLPFVKTFCGSYDNAVKVFKELHEGKPLFENVFYKDKTCKKEIYSAISLADRECHFFGSVHPGRKEGETDDDSDDDAVKTMMAYKETGGKHGMKIFLDKKECKKSADFRMKVSEKCQKISHGGHSMYGTLSYAEIETPVVDYYVFLGLLALIFAGVWAMVRFMGSKKAEGRGKYQPVMI